MKKTDIKIIHKTKKSIDLQFNLTDYFHFNLTNYFRKKELSSNLVSSFDFIYIILL